MKNIMFIAFCFIGMSLIAQDFDTRQIRKEVQLEQLNDDIVLTIKTIDGDNITEEIFKGEEAKNMLAELEKVDEKKIVSNQEVKEEIHLEEVEGVKKLTIKRTENGEISEEVYFGVDADKKIYEIESRENMQMKISIEE